MRFNLRFSSPVRVLVLAFSLWSTAAVQGAVNAWSSIGPESEPTIHSLVVDWKLPATIYAGGVGTIWTTENGGARWNASTLSQRCDVRALVLHPAESSTLYAGCFGVLKSTDAGRTWTSSHSGMESGDSLPAVWAIAINPSTPATMYAATASGDVFKSIDAGAHWKTTGRLPNSATEIRALVIDPVTSTTIYAAATRGGIFKSLDGGDHWITAHGGLPTDAVTSLAIDLLAPATLYAGTIGEGVFKTTDAGLSWVEMLGPDDVGGVSFTVAELVIDPFHRSTLYAAMGDADLGVFQTTDAGATWRSISTGLPSFAALRAFAIAPSSPSRVYAGSVDQYPGYVDGGVFAITSDRCPPAAATSGIAEFAIPTVSSRPLGIAAGPDCALWFTETGGNKIGRISITGEITEFAIPTPSSNASRIVTGADGALWFTETDGNKIGRITTAGAITEFVIPTPKSFPIGITTGPDGNMWFAEQGGHKIGRITPAGVITEFLIPPLDSFASLPLAIVAGADGNLWFSEYFTGRVGRITTAGVITLFVVEPSCCASLGEITAGPDGNIWFTEQSENRIVRMTPSGEMEYFALASPGQSQGAQYTAYGIVGGPDGAIWFTHGAGRIGRITTNGLVSELPVPTADGDPEIIAVGPDGNLWFTELLGNKIGRISPPSASAPPRRRAVRR